MVDYAHRNRLAVDRAGKALNAHLQHGADRRRHVLTDQDKNAAIGQVARLHLNPPERRMDEFDEGGAALTGMATLIFHSFERPALICTLLFCALLYNDSRLPAKSAAT